MNIPRTRSSRSLHLSPKLLALVVVGAAFACAPARVAHAKLPDVPNVIPVPSGTEQYGNYCSLTYRGGGWAFGALPGTTSDPCGQLLQQFPGGSIRRAGLWSTSGVNNVMAKCTDGGVMNRGTGAGPIDLSYNQVLGSHTGACVFTIAPLNLPVFDPPYVAFLNHVDNGYTVFNYDIFNQPWNVADFGQTPNSYPNACAVDRKGTQQCYLIPSNCPYVNGVQDCRVYTGNTFEGAYDWTIRNAFTGSTDVPLLAVADGIVRSAWARPTGCTVAKGYTDPNQEEVFIEHQVGTGEYAEHFVSAYHHMRAGSLTVVPGQSVKRGDVIGHQGSTGCSTGDHLDYSLIKLTNLSGARQYVFNTPQPGVPWLNPADPTLADGYGVNGIQGAIDPFGWAAPQGIDPWAWKFMGQPALAPNGHPAGVTDIGAFSINMWRTVYPAPPANH